MDQMIIIFRIHFICNTVSFHAVNGRGIYYNANEGNGNKGMMTRRGRGGVDDDERVKEYEIICKRSEWIERSYFLLNENRRNNNKTDNFVMTRNLNILIILLRFMNSL